MKKIISLSLALLLILANIIFVSADEYKNPFNDVLAAERLELSGLSYIGIGTKRIKGSDAQNGSYAKFGAFDFSDAPGSIQLMLGTSKTEGATLEIRLDNPTSGKLISTVSTNAGNGFTTALPYTSEINHTVTGVHDIYIVWQGKADLMSFKFLISTSINVKQEELTNAIQLGNGYLEVPFNNMIDPNTVDGNILLTDLDGIPVDGFETIVDGRSVLVLFDELDTSSTYKLIVTSGLKSKNGYNCEEFTKELTVETDSDVKFDFSGEDFVVGETPPNMAGLIFVSNDVKNDKTNFKVKTEEGYKFIRLNANKEQVGNCLVIDLENIGYDEYIELTYKVRLGSDTGTVSSDSKTMAQIVDSTKTGYGYTIITSRFKGTSVTAYSNQVWQGYGMTETMSGNASLSYNNTDEFGFSDVKIILKKDRETDYIIVEQHNPYDVTSEPFVKLCNSDLVKITNLNEVALVHYYPIKGSALTDYIDIKDIKYTKKALLKTLYNNTSDADIDSDGIEVLFNQKIDENSLSGIILKEKDSEKVIPCSASLLTTKMVNINPDYYTMPGKTYVVSMNGVKSTTGVTISQNIEFTVPGTAVQTAMYDASGNATNDVFALSKVTAQDVTENSYLVICAYDTDGRISKIVSGSGYSELDSLDTLDWNNIKIYTWLKYDGRISPLMPEASVITKGTE